jgi:DNA-binding NtrC family response regulator
VKVSLLLAAADNAAGHALEKLLREQRYGVEFVHDTQAALRAIDGSQPDALVAELRTARVDGLALLKRALALRPDVCAVLLGDDPRAGEDAWKAGASDVQSLPPHPARLLKTLERGAKCQALARANESLEQRLDEHHGFESFVGHGPEAARVIREARKAAASDEPWLLQGPEGSGRTTLALAIHQNSRRRGGPFAESEKDAQGGTWLARSIPSAIPDKGARLLVVSTQAGLPNVLRVPALHERPEDIPLLVDGFLKEFNREHGRRVTGITRGALEQLAAYDWPGNVRELRTAIEAGVVFAEGRRPLDVSDLPHAVRDATGRGRTTLSLPLSLSLSEVEKRFMEETLRDVSYDKSRAAATLGIGLRTLYRKLKEYEIG